MGGYAYKDEADHIARKRETKRKTYAKNREHILAYAASYREANADKIKSAAEGKHAAYSAKYRNKNYGKCLQMTQAWKDANPDNRKLTQAKWLQKNLDKHRTYQHNRRAKKKEVGGTLSPDLAERLFVIQRGKCACCGKQLGDTYDMDHIMPIAMGGSNTDNNIQLLISRCNRQKGAKHPVEFMQSRGLLL